MPAQEEINEDPNVESAWRESKCWLDGVRLGEDRDQIGTKMCKGRLKRLKGDQQEIERL